MRLFKLNKGFTLIELLVVIVIIGALATMLTANFVGVRQRGRDAQRKSDLRQIQSAFELYRADNGTYPTSLPTCGSSFPTTGSTIYLKKVPCDPLTNTGYSFAASPTGCDNISTQCIAYTLYACIENANDSSKDVTTQSCPTASYTLTNP